jgi:hypothetical protein
VITARRGAAALAILLLAMQVVRPARTNPVTDPSRAIGANAPLTIEAAEVLDRACRDCHSNDTTWPWYSNVAPMSWFVIQHVNDGRRHFNYSRWSEYDDKHRREFLNDSCDLARRHDMPLSSYTWIHANARLSDRDIEALCGWASVALRASH